MLAHVVCLQTTVEPVSADASWARYSICDGELLAMGGSDSVRSQLADVSVGVLCVMPQPLFAEDGRQVARVVSLDGVDRKIVTELAFYEKE